MASYKKKLLAELDEAKNKADAAKKARVEAETQLKKLQQTNKVITIITILITEK